MGSTNETLAHNMKRLRKRAGYTQNQIAEYLGVDQTSISKMEDAQRGIGVAALEKLCDLYQCTINDLIDDAGSARVQEHPYASISYRTQGLGGEDLHALAAVGRVVRNLEEMTRFREELE